MQIRQVFAQNLMRNRLRVGMSQEELAHAARVDRTYVSSLERCVYAASIDIVDRFAAVFDIEASSLLERQKAKAPADAQ